MSGYNVTAGVFLTPPNSHRSVPAMSYNQGMHAVLAAFGLTPTSKLPAEGRESHVVDGVKVWINPQGPAVIGRYGRAWKRSTHRVMCECPDCGAVMSFGRLHQHRHTAACARRSR